MRIRSSTKGLVALALVAYAAAPASAQPGPATGNGTSPTSTSPNSASSGTSERKTQLTPQEQLDEGKKHISRMEQSAGSIRNMLSQARKDHDVVKTLCLNDKLSQADVAVRSGRERSSQLQAAVARNDAELANHEFTILTVLRQRSEQIATEANQCVGEESAFVGDTQVTMSVSSTIPPDEAAYPQEPDPSLVAPPPCTSCTL